MPNIHSSLAWQDSLVPGINAVTPEVSERWKEFMPDFREMDEVDALFDMRGEQEREDMKILKKRKRRWLYKRMDWQSHVRKLVHQEEFERTYGMRLQSFNKLVSVLLPDVQRKLSKSRVPEPVFPELIVAVGLRYLRGGMVSDLKEVYGTSRSEIYHCRRTFLAAVLVNERLRIKMPSTEEEWNEVRLSFLGKSSMGLMRGCVGALDGFLQAFQAPRKKDAQGNVDAFHSGHYDCHGLNCQALCDAFLRFLFFGVVAPGRTNDSMAIHLAKGLKTVLT